MSAVMMMQDALFGNPPVPDYNPSREGMLNAFTELFNQTLSLVSGIQSYTGGVASLPSSGTIAPIGTQARVIGDVTGSNNTYWVRKALTGGNNGWSIDTDLIASLAAVVQPLVDAAAASASAAATSAAAIVTTGSLNRWKDAYFRALYDANASALVNPVRLDGLQRFTWSSGSPSWDLVSSPFGNPSLVMPNGGDIYNYVSDGVFRIGENCRAKVGVIVPTGTTFTAQLIIRTGFLGANVATGTAANIVGNGAYQEIDLAALANVANGTAYMIRFARTVGTGTITVCAAQLVTGTQARPMAEDTPTRYRADAAFKLASSASVTAIAASDLINAVLVPAKNLFNPDDPGYEINKFISSTTGASATPTPIASDYSATGFIPVVPGQTYTRSASHQMAFYDVNKVYVSGRAALAGFAAETFTVPNTGTVIAFMRLSIPAARLSRFQVEVGSAATSHEPYRLVLASSYLDVVTASIRNLAITADKIADGAVTPIKTSFLIASKNLFNIDDPANVLGSFARFTDGAIIANAAYNATHFVPVVPGQTYTLSFSHQRAFYDANQVFVTGTNSGNPATFTVPANCFFARFSVAIASWANFQVEVGSVATSFAAYGYGLDPDMLPGSLANVSNGLTVNGDSLVNPFQPEMLRQTRYRLTRRSERTPANIQCIINIAGDSYSHLPSRWVTAYAEYMTGKYGDAGGGWCGFGFLLSGNVAPWAAGNQPSFSNGNIRPTTYPTRHYGNGSGTYYTANSPDLAMTTLTQAGDLVLQAFPATPVHDGCDLHFIGTSNGQIRFSWGSYDGSGDVSLPANYTFGGTTTVAVQGTVGALQIADIKAGMPSGAGMLRIEWVAGTVNLAGVNLKSSAAGVRLNKLAATGSNASQWANAPLTVYTVGLANLDSHLFIYMDGTNSQGGSISPARWGDHITNLVNSDVRAGVKGSDFLLITPPENQRTTNTVFMTDYAIEGRKRARLLRCAFLDLQEAFGDPANPEEYGATANFPTTSVIPLFATDNIHPDPLTGGRAILGQVINATARPLP